MASGMASAAEKPTGQPFQALWDAIENIELIPGPQGEPGADGATGPQGEPGAEGPIFAKYYTSQVSSGTPVSHLKTKCDLGDIAIGGGAYSNTGLNTSRPSDGNTGDVPADGIALGWIAFFASPSAGNVYAICADVAEPFRNP